MLEGYCLQNIHENYFTCSSLKELFKNVDATTIMNFIKQISFYHLLYVFSYHFTSAMTRALFLHKCF